MTALERPLTFDCEGDRLVGILHKPAEANAMGVLVIVGGPQYRVGSHRQFLLLARALAEAGYPTLRFDYRGMGDSDGDFRGFEAVDADIRAALDAFQKAVPEMREVALWGLCDAASAILFYAAADPRVSRMVLLNPWVRTEAGQARAMLRHYYLGQLKSGAFWRKLSSGQVAVWPALRDFARTAVARLGVSVGGGGEGSVGLSEDSPSGESPPSGASLPERMAAGLECFEGLALIILSGRDMTAREFEDAAEASPTWSRLLRDQRVTIERLPEADHTFSRAAWRARVEEITCRWLGD